MRRALLLALALCAAPAFGESLPEGACYLERLSPAELAAVPGRGVAALSLEFLPLRAAQRAAGEPYRHVRLRVRMAAQGQARRDGAMSMRLSATASCGADGPRCWNGGNAQSFTLERLPGGEIALSTRHFPLADFGDTMIESDLAEAPGRETRYRLRPVPLADCGRL